jgi:endonuclease/exonuclease/phosphatase (EEP) superfamily protein YafD
MLALLGVLAATLAPFFHGAWPLLGLLQHFAVQLGAASALLLIAALLLRLWRPALLAVLLTVWHGAVLYPFLPFPDTRAVEAGPPLKLLSLNLWYENEDHARTIQALLASGADVIATVETTAEWRGSLTALAAAYPYRIDCVGKAFRCGVALYSKLPFKDSFAGRIDGALPTIVTVTIDWQGRPLKIAALQLINPLIGLEEDFQAEQASVATRYFAQLQGDLVVMGDFNSTPWSDLQNGFRAATGLDNRGRLAFTWPSWAPALFRLPIDQIFVKGGIVARNVRPGAPEGSDHLPITAEIYWGEIYREAQ